MKASKRRPAILITSLIIIAAFGLVLLPEIKERGRKTYSHFPLSRIVRAAEVNPWTRAIEKIREDRGEPVGRQAKLEIPSELRHYSDTRRFLAVQVAEWREHTVRTPQDFVDLASMLRQGELVSVQPVTENFVLFGVGGNADKDNFTRFQDGRSVRLYSEASLQGEQARLTESIAKQQASVSDLKRELSAVGRRERSRRSRIQAQVNAAEKTLKTTREENQLLDRSYSNPQTREKLFAHYESLNKLSKTFPDRDFNIEDSTQRRDLKVRLLSSLRPEALKVLEEIASSYREAFDRPLPVTSLVRPDEYQLELSKVNANATRIETPPHSTGLAFDIYYGYMTAAEQSHVMTHLAKLKDAGRIEVLRENRNHYHVFAFVDGTPPKEALISAAISERPSVKTASKASDKKSNAHHASRTIANKAKRGKQKPATRKPRVTKRRR